MSKISIVIPVYNAEKVIGRCMDSVAAQTHTDFEVLLINDGSTDNSPAICAEYCAKDPRFKLITQPNGGPSAARNRGLEEATGKYIAFIDSDDYIEPNAMEVLNQKAEESGAEITVFGYYIERDGISTRYSLKYEPGVYTGEACKQLSIEAIDIHTKQVLPPYSWIRFVQADFLKGLDLRFDTSIIRSEDYLFWVQVHFRANTVCIATDHVLYHYVENSSSITHRYVKGYWEMAKNIYTRLKEVLPDEPTVAHRLRVMFIHRSLIALNNASRCTDAVQFKREVKEIICDPLFRKVLNELSVKQGLRAFKAYYILAKLRCTPVIIKRYQLKATHSH